MKLRRRELAKLRHLSSGQLALAIKQLAVQNK
jgi:hypothetical protein